MTCALFLKGVRREDESPSAPGGGRDPAGGSRGPLDPQGGHGPHGLDALHGPHGLDSIEGLLGGVWCVSESLEDPLLHESGLPWVCLILYFRSPEDLMRACVAGSPLGAMLADGQVNGVPVAEPSYQAMEVHCFPVNEAVPSEDACGDGHGYLVGYEGDPADPAAWIAEYMEGHVPLMQALPGIREIEVYTRLESCPIALPGARQDWMLRNRVRFDDREAMQAALRSPARAALRAHRAGMAAHGGADEHIPVSMRKLPI